MAGAALEIRSSVHGVHAIERKLNGIIAGVEDAEPLFDEIGGIMVASTQHNFESGKSPDGVAWIPSERALAEGGQTLIDKGILLSSITHDAGPDYAEWGSNLVYAGIHQFGGETGRGGATKLPAREYLGIGIGDEFAIVAAAEDYLGELLR